MSDVCFTSLKFQSLTADQQSNDKAEETQYTRENFDDQHLDEHTRVSSICQSSTAPVDSNADTTDEVAHSDRQSRPEQCIPRVVIRASVQLLFRDKLNLRGENDRHDDSVDSDDFAEDN